MPFESMTWVGQYIIMYQTKIWLDRTNGSDLSGDDVLPAEYTLLPFDLGPRQLNGDVDVEKGFHSV